MGQCYLITLCFTLKRNGKRRKKPISNKLFSSIDSRTSFEYDYCCNHRMTTTLKWLWLSIKSHLHSVTCKVISFHRIYLCYRNILLLSFCSNSFHFQCIRLCSSTRAQTRSLHSLSVVCSRQMSKIIQMHGWWYAFENISLKLLSAMKTIINGFQLNQKTNQLSTVYICPFDTNFKTAKDQETHATASNSNKQQLVCCTCGIKSNM